MNRMKIKAIYENIDNKSQIKNKVNVIDPYNKKVGKIFGLLDDVNAVAQSIGILNIHRPGLVRDLLTAQRLHHNVMEDKHGPSACDRNDEGKTYQYYHSTESGACQIHDFHNERDEIFMRNEAIYMVFYEKEDHLEISRIYKLPPQDTLREAKNQYNKSTKEKVHIAFKEEWCKMIGTLVDSKKTENN